MAPVSQYLYLPGFRKFYIAFASIINCNRNNNVFDIKLAKPILSDIFKERTLNVHISIFFFWFCIFFILTIKSSHYPRKIENLHAYQWHPTFRSPVLLLGHVTYYYHCCYHYVKIVILYFRLGIKINIYPKEKKKIKQKTRLISYNKPAAKTQEVY